MVRQVSPTVESQVMQHSDWTHNAVGYQVNLYDQSAAGDLAGLTADLSRLRALGVDYLILPPVYEGDVIRDTLLLDFKAFTDFRKIDDHFGTSEDFQDLIVECHSRGMKVLLTWPSGQIGEKNQWVKDYPQIFDDSTLFGNSTKFWDGVMPMTYKSDTTFGLISSAWEYWLDDFKVDGFYCTESELVPLDFWERLRTEVGEDRNGFFMASDRPNPDYHTSAFDMTSTPRLHETLIEVSQGNFPPEAIDLFIQQHERDFPLNAFRELYATKSRITASKGSLRDQFGEAHKLVGILMFTLPGMPTLYCGQEADETVNNQLLKADSIDFENASHSDFYQKLIEAHHQNKALWSGLKGGRYERLTTAEDQSLFAFSRTKGENKVVVILNFSNEPTDVNFQKRLEGTYTSIFNNEMLSIFTEGDVKLPPYGYQVFMK